MLRRVLRAFFATNVWLSEHFAARFGVPSDKPLWGYFDSAVQVALAEMPEGATLLDLGGGRTGVFSSWVPEGKRARLVALDISPAELEMNRAVDLRVAADVTQPLPFEVGSVDFVASRALLEHVADTRQAIANLGAVMPPGARTVHLVPGRYSLFAAAARLLPFDKLKGLLHLALPLTAGVVEFDVFYDRCSPDQLRRCFADAGFRKVDIEVTWSQSDYFRAVFPLYLLVVAYDGFMAWRRLERFATYQVVVAER